MKLNFLHNLLSTRYEDHVTFSHDIYHLPINNVLFCIRLMAVKEIRIVNLISIQNELCDTYYIITFVLSPELRMFRID